MKPAKVSKLSKLKAMNGAELRHRGTYAAFTAVERQLWRAGWLRRENRLRGSLRRQIARQPDWTSTLLSRAHGGRFFASFSDLDRLQDVLASNYREEVVKAKALGDDVLAGEIAFFGESFFFPERMPWHLDPLSGVEWPRSYHRDVPVHGGNVGYGDVKHVWEINRHQFLVDLAKIALLEESRQHASRVTSLVDDWLTEAPYGTGAPWACALEPAFRAWSWMWAYHMLRAADMIEPDVHLRWLNGFLDHGRFLYRHLERYSSPYNHLIGEASALFALGLLFPEFAEASRWAARGQAVLEQALAQQFYTDGGTVEQSAFYHHATLGFYLLSMIIARQNGVSMAPEVVSAVERALEFSVSIVQPDGRVPSVGGADDGKPIRIEHLPFWNFQPYYALGAVLYKRADFKEAAGRFWEDALWLLGPAGLDEFEALPSRAPATVTVLPESGYCVFRSGRAEDADYVLFDCGEQAAGLRRDGVPSAAHGHADCLSIVAALGGRNVLVDPGFFCYNGDPWWEVYFRKTGAHNTVSIDGLDQATHVSKMAWTHTYQPSVEGWSTDDDLGWARASHDGYERYGVKHTRTIWLRSGGYLIVLDEMSASEPRMARANFQFADDRLRLESRDAALFAGRFETAWLCSTGATATVVDSGEGPGGGWIATSLGVRRRAPRLVIDFPLGHSNRPVTLMTIIADRARQPYAMRRRAVFSGPEDIDGQSVLTARVAGAGFEDRIIATRGSGIICTSGIETDATLAAVRFQHGEAADMRWIGGSGVHVGGQRLAIVRRDGTRILQPRHFGAIAGGRTRMPRPSR